MKQITLESLTAEEAALYNLEETTYLIQLIGGRLIEISQRMAVINPEVQQLKSESAYLKVALSASQSALRAHRLALGGD